MSDFFTSTSEAKAEKKQNPLPRVFWCFFFFQAEDGIRDDLVTGVQTCALPICCFPFTRSRMKGKQHGNFSQQNATPRLHCQGTGGLGSLARRDWGSSYDAARGRWWLVDQGYRGSLNGLAPPVGSALSGASES